MPMTEEAARQTHDEFLARLRASGSWLALARWETVRPIAVDEQDAWLFWYTNPALRGDDYLHEVVLVRKDGRGAFTLFGAIGKVYLNHDSERLGLPTSSERWLGSGPGRYQTFERGYVLWDELPDLG